MLNTAINNAANRHSPLMEVTTRISMVGYLNDELLELQKDSDYFMQKWKPSK